MRFWRSQRPAQKTCGRRPSPDGGSVDQGQAGVDGRVQHLQPVTREAGTR